MSRAFDPGRERPDWAPDPVPCVDCGTLLDPGDWFGPGQPPCVCRACQNKRYEARIRHTPQGERRRRRKSLLAKQRRLELRIKRDSEELANVRKALAE